MKWHKLGPPLWKWWQYELFYAHGVAVNVFAAAYYGTVANGCVAVAMVAMRLWVNRYLSRKRSE